MKEYVGWAGYLKAAAESLGYRVQQHGCLWRDADKRVLPSKIHYADGYDCIPIHIGGKNHALSIRPRRIYFEAGNSIPSGIPEHALLNDARAPSHPSVPTRIHACTNLAAALIKAGYRDLSPEPVAPAYVHTGLLHSTCYVIGEDQHIPVSEKLSSALLRHGVFRTPDKLQPLVFSASAHLTIAETYARILQNAFRRLKLSSEVKAIAIPDNPTAMARYVERIKQRGAGTLPVIGVPGHRGTPIPANILDFMRSLEESGIRYRLFSVDNHALQWSGLDQAGIMIDCAGGQTFHLELPWPETAKQAVILGLDLGHPRATRQSWLAATLFSSNGCLINACRFAQPRDETIRQQTLEHVFSWTNDALARKGIAPDGFMVLRDGRLFERESVDHYRRSLGGKITFADVTKNPVPIMVQGEGAAAPGNACVMPSGTMAFLMGSHGVVPDHLPKPVKIHLRHDGLGIGMERLLHIIAGLCYAPTLGLRPTRLPAPTYWADGFAGISETNHQFAGLGHETFSEIRKTEITSASV